jgi:hypothetical protein
MDTTAYEVLTEKIGKEDIRKARHTLEKYKTGKKNFENKLIDNEEWWKLHQWKRMDSQNTNEDDPRPASAWLFNCIISKHADAMDSYPTFNCLPREAADKQEAEKLSSILPVVLEQNGFEDTYSDVAYQKLKSGTGCYGVFWDGDKLNGLGDITINKIDLLNLFWEPGINDIQKSRNVFHTELVDNEVLIQSYPQLEGKLGGKTTTVSEYVYDDTINTQDKSLVIDWYYKVNVDGRKILHYCKFVNDEILSATENDPEMVNGLYDHGLYPFILDPLFPMEGTPCGFGYIDVCKEPQKYIDVLNQAILENSVAASVPRWFVRDDSAINEDDLMDFTKHVIRVGSNLSEESLRPINVQQLSGNYINVLDGKINELKETSGNRDVNNGGSTSGVTAASAIAALQESSGKTSRDSTQASYRAYAKVIDLCIELIRQFYDTSRQFRIVGQMGIEEFTSYNNQGLKPMPQGMDFGIEAGMRKPVFDLKITAQKNSPYNKMAQNELALQFFQLGFFNPQLADQALACVEMMDFDGKNELMQKISLNQTLAQQLAMFQQMALGLAQKYEPEIAEGLASVITGNPMMSAPMGNPSIDIAETNADGSLANKNTIVEKAKANTQEATRPR